MRAFVPSTGRRWPPTAGHPRCRRVSGDVQYPFDGTAVRGWDEDPASPGLPPRCWPRTHTLCGRSRPQFLALRSTPCRTCHASTWRRVAPTTMSGSLCQPDCARSSNAAVSISRFESNHQTTCPDRLMVPMRFNSDRRSCWRYRRWPRKSCTTFAMTSGETRRTRTDRKSNSVCRGGLPANGTPGLSQRSTLLKSPTVARTRTRPASLVVRNVFEDLLDRAIEVAA